MKILIADDDFLTRQMIGSLLTKWGHEVVSASNGKDAWDILKADNRLQMAILDRIMPGMEGTDICHKFRKLLHAKPTYIILLTYKVDKADVVAGLDAGANDYITKPFDHEELRARVHVGVQMTELQITLANRIKKLQDIILPICSYCKKIRDDQNYWRQLESYFAIYSDVRFSHGICPECYEKHVRTELDEME